MTSGSVVLGVVSGLIIGFLAVGVVLVYKANRFLNLAHAQFGVFSAVLLAKLVIDRHWNWWAAFAVCVPLGSVLAVAAYQLLIKRLQQRTKSTVVLLLASIGVTQLLLAFNFVPALGAKQGRFNESGGFPLPFTSQTTVGGVVLHGDRILTLILVPLLVAGLVLALRYTRFGKMTRAAAANVDEARLCGVPVHRVSTAIWAIAGAMSAITAILVARSEGVGTGTSLSGVSQSFGPDLLLLALGAAALGGFRSIWLALVGGLGLGVAQQLTLAETGNGGTATLVMFVLILLVVFVRGRSIAAAFGVSTTVVDDQGPLRIPRVLESHALVRSRLVVLSLAGIFVGALAPLLPYLKTNPHRFLLVMILVYAMVSVSLTILVGWGGQVSLGQLAVVGAGAYMAARMIPHGLTVPVVLLLSGFVGAGFMLIVGLPALRIRGLTLAVTTLGLAVIAPAWVFRQTFIGSKQSFGLLVEQPPRLAAGLGRPTSMLALYYVALAALGLTVVATHGLRRSRVGRLFVAIRDNERASEAFGIAPATVKLAMLAVSGMIAGSAGGIHAVAWRSVTTNQFSPVLSLSVLAVPVIGGLGSLAGAIIGAVALYAPTFFLAPHLSWLFGRSGALAGFQLVLAGLTLPVILLTYPTGIAGALRQRVQRRIDRMAVDRSRPEVVGTATPLQVDGASIRFGGVQALNGASITVGPGEIVGLIGPNGAGKSTLINVISGVFQPVAGSVSVFGHEVVGLPASFRAAFGLGRSFQDAHLFPGLTVTEAIQVALSRRHRNGILSSMVWAPWSLASERRCRARARELIARFGLEPWQDALTSELSTGTRRVCDLAAQVASGSKVLLLDEPTAGVAQREAEAFGPLLRRIRDELDCSILIVEHDMPLLMGLCDRVYAMDLGAVIAEGTPAEVRANPAVIASYLGTDETAIARSGLIAPTSGNGAGRTRSTRTKKEPIPGGGVG
jgi:ABC-type branched-subunit amino acid transport system ATPase component/ABC-type branched-subunit amino acid transport system permease subunit